jgi:hypothetical protein
VDGGSVSALLRLSSADPLPKLPSAAKDSAANERFASRLAESRVAAITRGVEAADGDAKGRGGVGPSQGPELGSAGGASPAQVRGVQSGALRRFAGAQWGAGPAGMARARRGAGPSRPSRGSGYGAKGVRVRSS